MKSGHYIAIFIAVVVVVGGLIVFNARTITEINEDMVHIPAKKSVVAEKKVEVEQQVVQKKIDVMKDADIEFDAEDAASEEQIDLSDVEALMADEIVSF